MGYLRGEEPLESAAERLCRSTRRYAKRQMTWFSAKPYVRWITVDETDDPLREALDLIGQERFA